MNAGFEVSVEDRHPLAILHLSGSIAAMGIYKVKAMMDVSLRDGNKYLILDLTEVSFLDSAGIGLLLQIRNSYHSSGGAIILVRPTAGQVRHTLDISSLNTLIPFCDTIRDALEYAHTKFGVVLTETSEPLAPEGLTEMVRDLSSRLARVEQRLDRLEAKEGN